MPVRYDGFEIDAARIRPTGSGGICVDGICTRTGVYGYTDSNGKTILEYRSPEEVFAEPSVSSLDGVAVTIRHPRGAVTRDNWGQLAIGHAAQPRKDEAAQGVAAKIVVSRGDAVGRVGKDLREISCGYTCDLDMTPGVTPDGKRYDAVQRNISYNHVGLGPSGWGRQGPQSALRLDSAGDQIEPQEEPEKKDPTHMKIKIDGVEFEAATEAELQAKIDAHNAAKGTTSLTEQLAAEKGRADTLAKQVADEKKRADEAPAAARAAVEARVKLEGEAVKFLGKDHKFDGQTDRQIRIAVVQKFDSAFVDSAELSDAYLAGVYTTRISTAPEAGRQKQDGILTGLSAGARKAPGSSTETTVKNDGLDRDAPSASAARAKMMSGFGAKPSK